MRNLDKRRELIGILSGVLPALDIKNAGGHFVGLQRYATDITVDVRTCSRLRGQGCSDDPGRHVKNMGEPELRHRAVGAFLLKENGGPANCWNSDNSQSQNFSPQRNEPPLGNRNNALGAWPQGRTRFRNPDDGPWQISLDIGHDEVGPLIAIPSELACTNDIQNNAAHRCHLCQSLEVDKIERVGRVRLNINEALVNGARVGFGQRNATNRTIGTHEFGIAGAGDCFDHGPVHWKWARRIHPRKETVRTLGIEQNRGTPCLAHYNPDGPKQKLELQLNQFAGTTDTDGFLPGLANHFRGRAVEARWVHRAVPTLV